MTGNMNNTGIFKKMRLVPIFRRVFEQLKSGRREIIFKKTENLDFLKIFGGFGKRKTLQLNGGLANPVKIF